MAASEVGIFQLHCQACNKMLCSFFSQYCGSIIPVLWLIVILYDERVQQFSQDLKGYLY